MSHRTVARVALGYLALTSLQLGVWALLAPQAFYDNFPGLGGRMWISVDGPYNEHFIRDVGALNLALAFLLVTTMIRPSRDLLFVSAGSSLAWGVPHLIYHLVNTDSLSGSDIVMNIGGLGLFAVCGIALVRAASLEPTNAALAGAT